MNKKHDMKRFRKLIVAILVGILCPLADTAQSSSMTDEQIMSYILKEHENGRTQEEIAMRLMQRGVDIQQVQRVRKKMERLQNQQGLGAQDDGSFSNTANGQNRLRQNNTQEKLDPRGNLSSKRIQKPRIRNTPSTTRTRNTR